MKQENRIAVVGGDGRESRDLKGVDTFMSQRQGGNRTNKTLLARIMNGRYKTVLVLTKFIGHSLANNLRRACRNFGVELRFVNGGRAALFTELKMLELED